MIEAKYEGNVAILDVRELIKQGQHPKQEIMSFVTQAKVGTVVEIHVPYRAQPLISALKSLGINAIINELAPDDFRIMCVKV